MSREEWRVVAASVEGSRHTAAGLPCQDAHRAVVDGSTLIIAVADGAGSAARAEIGAQRASAFSAELLGQVLSESDGTGPDRLGDVMLDALRATRRMLRRTAMALDCPLGDLATTLLLVVAVGESMAVAQVGDGAVVVARDDGLDVLGATVRSEFINETCFLTSARWRTSATIEVVDATGVTAISVMTDGLQLLALDIASNRPHPPFFAPLHAFATSEHPSTDELASFLRSERVCAWTDDDKTLVVAARLPS